MREILFRGKSIHGEWIYGYYCPKPYSHFPCEATIFPSETIDRDWHGEMVDPSTIGQFTGLEDKLGTKIFEGDVIDDLGVEYIVVFDSDYAQFRGKFDGWNAEISHIASRCEVIGNIHDNPELLEVNSDE
jgi:hypothetical protein